MTQLVPIPWVRYPGTWLDLPREEEGDATNLVDLAQDALARGYFALGAFQEACKAESRGHLDDEEDRKRRMAWRALDDHVAGERPEQATPDALAVETQIRAIQWLDAADLDPLCYAIPSKIFHAESFALSLHRIFQAMAKARTVGSIKAASEQGLAALHGRFPGLAGLRNSISHSEDRFLGLNRKKERIQPEPIDVPGFVRSTGGGMVIGNLLGDTYSYVADGGELAQLDVKPETLALARGSVEEWVQSLPWVGPAHVKPHVGYDDLR